LNKKAILVTTPSENQEIVHVNLSKRSYDIAITSGQQESLVSLLPGWLEKSRFGFHGTGKIILVTDDNVRPLFAENMENSLKQAGWQTKMHSLTPGEKSKSLGSISKMYDELVNLKADRQTVVIAIGGGVIGDAAGFLASSYTRGLPFVQMPTSLLAQVDSSVGGKVGINHAQGKNLIGAFYQPVGVFIDTDVIQTLPDRDFHSGLAEVVKYGVILDQEFFEYLEKNTEGILKREAGVLRHIIARSCRLKADVVEQDEEERTGLRAVLNYGHTFAHAYEALCGYGELMHGEAVSIGMVDASRLAEKRGLIDSESTQRQIELLTKLNLPVSLPEGSNLDTGKILDRMLLDKKVVGGKLRFVLPDQIGHVEVFTDIDVEDVKAVLEREDV
jgi:3-dehydroquinate synthase